MTKDLSKQLCELCGIEQTVDFTKPENFVRLRGIVTGSTGEDFVKSLIMRLTFVNDCYSDKIKQSIREAEWVYD